MSSSPRTLREAAASLPVSPLVGRGPATRELSEALDRAIATKRPEVVTLVGSAGIGKTRLLHEFLAATRKREDRVRVFRGACREQGPAFGVVQRILRSRFGVIEGAPPEETQERFRAAVTQSLGDRRVTEFLHFLGAFLDLRFPDSPFIKAVEEDPRNFAVISRAVLRRFFEVDSSEHPTVLTFEELHWAPSDTLDLVQYLVETLSDSPILVVIVARPELLARRPDWAKAGRERHTMLELAPLAPDDAAQLVYHLLAPTGDPPDELVEAAVKVAGGSPYLLEQMVRAFLANGTLTPRKGGSWAVDLSRLGAAKLPLSVEEAIGARIASLTPAERELLEKASTMGGVFWMGALVALSRLDEPTPELWGGHESIKAHLSDMLENLAARDFLMALPDSTIPGETEYAFKHHLERESLHRLASTSRLKRYHLVVAEWLEFRLGERAEEHGELLARHFEEGHAHRRAADYYLRAGDKARGRYANPKAAEHYARGLQLLDEAEVVHRLNALHHYGDVLQLSGRNDEALLAFRSMLEMAFRLDLKSKGGAAHNRIGRLYRAIGQLDEAMRHLGTGHALFDAAGDLRGVASSLDDVGKVHWMRGNYGAAERFGQQALEHRRALGDERSIALSLNNLGLVYQDSGRFREALEVFQEALELRRSIDDKPGIAQTLNNLGTIHQDNGEHEEAVTLYREALEVTREIGDRMHEAVMLTNLGESLYRQKRPADAVRMLKEAEEISNTLGDRILEGEILRALAKAHMLIHDLPKARDYIARSVSLFEQARGKPYLGVALRTQAEIYAAAGWGGEEHRLAKDCFDRSLQLFEELGNELEVANTCQAFAEFQEGTETEDPAQKAAARDMRQRAEDIRERLKASEEAISPLEGEPTNPRGKN